MIVFLVLFGEERGVMVFFCGIGVEGGGFWFFLVSFVVFVLWFVILG